MSPQANFSDARRSSSRQRRSAFLAMAALLLLAACGSGGSPPPAPPTPKAGGDQLPVTAGLPSATAAPVASGVADLGFRPEANSFSFPNYGKTVPSTDLTSVEMRALFGDGVCAAITGLTCELVPPAQDWMDRQNKSMGGGHCQGMSVTALLFYKGIIKASDFGAESVPALTFQGNDALQRRIAQSYAFQALPSVTTATVHGTPNDIVDALAKALADKGPMTYGLGIYMPDRSGGHEITPFEVVDHGGGQVGILVYDNNYPSVAREVLVDRTANTWTYTASTNPSESSSVYAGNATTNTLEIDPMEPGLGPQPCPFCAAAATAARIAPGSARLADSAAPQYEEIALDANPDDHAHLLITDAAGHRLGWTGGVFVNEIPGAAAEFPREDRVWKEAEEPLYRVPTGTALTITLDGTHLSSADTENVSIIGPAVDLNVDNILIAPGEKDSIDLSADRTGLKYAAGGQRTPTISAGTASPAVDYAFSLSVSAMSAGGVIDTTIAPDGVTLTSSASVTFDMEMLRQDNSAEATFKHTGVNAAAGVAGVLQYAGWQKRGDSIPYVVGGQTSQLSDQG